MIVVSCFKVLGQETNSSAWPNKSDGDTLTYTQKVELEYLFIEGLKYYLIEDYTEAEEKFKKCIAKKPDNPVFYYQYAENALKQNNIDQAITYGLKAQQIDPKNVYYYDFLVRVYELRHQHVLVSQTLRELIENKQANLKHYFHLANAYLEQGKNKEAIQVYDEIENIFEPELAIKQKYKLHLSNNDISRAIKEQDKLILIRPNDADLYVAQAKLFIAQNQLPQAEASLAKSLQIDPENMETQYVLADLYQKQNKVEKRQEILEVLLQSREFSIQKKMELLKSYLSKSSNIKYARRGLELSRLTIQSHPKHAGLQELYGKFIALNGNKSKAIDTFKKSLALNPNNYQTWEKLIQLLIHEKKAKSVLQTTEEALMYFPNQSTFWFYNGNAHLIEGNYQEAVEALEQSRVLAFADADLQFEILAHLGDAYHGLGNYNSAEMAYKEALTLRPDSPVVLNNYSYFLARQGKNIKEAKIMCQKLLEIEPTSSKYVDTYAWVLYANKEYAKAAKYLEQATKTSKSGVVFEHYGDALHQLGNTQKAIIQWKKAKKLGGKISNDIDQKIAGTFK